MKRFVVLFWTVCISLSVFSQGRGKIDIPNLKGYITLKCDFHTHTVYSLDGRVWPTIRIDEACREGLDAVAITDHLDRRLHDRKELPFVSHNQSGDIALTEAETQGIIFIRGTEVSLGMPPGHLNAIFLTNADELMQRDYLEVFRAAKAQNAYVMWNHPGDQRQPDTTLWWPEHQRLWEEGMLHGIEVAGGNVYYPEAHQWCLDKKLAIIGNSDAHGFRTPGSRRTMTLVFARSATAEGIREALDARRTAAYYRDFIIGEEKCLKELFENALEWKTVKTGKVVDGGEEVRVTVKNNSDLIFRLKKSSHDRRITYFRNTFIEPYTIAPQSTQTFTVRLLEGIKGGDVNFIVENFLVKPNTGMAYSLKVQ